MSGHREPHPATSFPQFAGKQDEEAIITPATLRTYWHGLGREPDESFPRGIAITYQRDLFDALAQRDDVRLVQGYPGPWRQLYIVGGGRVGVVGGFGVGAPVASMVLEELIAFGATRFVNVGAAGTLQRDLRAGDVMLCTSAIRDEGVSHHYLPSSLFSFPDESLTDALRGSLQRRGLPFREGPTWTIDTPFRETIAEARHYQEQGVLSVEMEAAAVFAVGQYRHVEVAAMFVVSDSLAELEWAPEFHAPEYRERLSIALDVAIDALR